MSQVKFDLTSSHSFLLDRREQTQKQRMFTRLLPSLRLTRFFTQLPPVQLQQALSNGFNRCCVSYSVPPITMLPTDQVAGAAGQRTSVHIAYFSTVDKRKCPLRGDVMATSAGLAPAQDASQAGELPLWVVVFYRRKGDPLEFKRLYQAVVESMAHAVYVRNTD